MSRKEEEEEEEEEEGEEEKEERKKEERGLSSVTIPTKARIVTSPSVATIMKCQQTPTHICMRSA